MLGQGAEAGHGHGPGELKGCVNGGVVEGARGAGAELAVQGGDEGGVGDDGEAVEGGVSVFALERKKEKLNEEEKKNRT